MSKDHFHNLFNNGVLLGGEGLLARVGRIGRRVLAFELCGEGENFLFGDEAILLEQFSERL